MKNMLKSITMSLVVVSFLACDNQADIRNERMATFKKDTIIKKEIVQEKTGWTNLATEDSTFIISMPYATKDNFLKEKIYPCAKCLLRTDAAKALLSAQKMAQKKGFTIIIYDCYRPLPLQQKMFDIKPDTKFVADPKRGSKHNKGVAVDISLADKNGIPLEMGTAFDSFSKLAHYNTNDISEAARANRILLREIMLANEFTPYDSEWWHFNYKNTNYPNEDFVWDCDE